jgi:hypothetical protein
MAAEVRVSIEFNGIGKLSGTASTRGNSSDLFLNAWFLCPPQFFHLGIESVLLNFSRMRESMELLF